jgi:hypothetical protein
MPRENDTGYVSITRALAIGFGRRGCIHNAETMLFACRR